MNNNLLDQTDFHLIFGHLFISAPVSYKAGRLLLFSLKNSYTIFPDNYLRSGLAIIHVASKFHASQNLCDHLCYYQVLSAIHRMQFTFSS